MLKLSFLNIKFVFASTKMAVKTDLDDATLLSLLREGKHAAFNEIHERYFSMLFRSAYNVLRDRDACMDVVQEVFVWFWEHRQKHEMHSIKGYLLMAVKYQVANFIRSGKVRESFFDRVTALKLSPEFNDTSLELKELKVIISQISSLLPERCREVFLLSREMHLNNKEIAEKMGIAEKTVEAQLTKALSRLRVQLAQMNFWMFLL
jgi:RNA polymerase sigma-70 factor (family 1)